MFALFFNLYHAMFYGQWRNWQLFEISRNLTDVTDKLFEFVTSIFGDFQVTDFGTALMANNQSGTPNYLSLISFVLALITSIGIVVMAVKGVKKAFGIFFGHIR